MDAFRAWNPDMLQAMLFDGEHQNIRQKQPRGNSNSATSRKNKLQRCSVCGGLGHKSRTCDLAARQASGDEDARSGPDEEPGSPTHDDPRIVMAAYSLLTLHATAAEEAQGLRPPPLSGRAQAAQEHSSSSSLNSWPYSPTMLKV